MGIITELIIIHFLAALYFVLFLLLYGFNVMDGKLTPRVSFLSSQQTDRAIKYLDLLRTGQIAEEDFFATLKSSPNCVLEGLYPLLAFNILRLSLPLYSAHLYQMAHQLRSYPLSGSKASAYFL
ncbi:hypothetical protein RO3G_11027 [Rhizopus delemar RA 99-880]|uniref:Uncharacterized protein n=1 Tax=Rhizopus delemar (strain RA 99-880 / ATCC MYA-4621 / FGSC 9543 / NRRL 43880) TaxID=246409 RepID=I1CCY6_RHIO9|nr:hypothetical protein RO3G_11027 [Rhizopus delemar RA 99-880]|eukprot:EIE86316.1 hypothetical protein RO3G_11027 [Rhizopus delemar RA 99-880]